MTYGIITLEHEHGPEVRDLAEARIVRAVHGLFGILYVCEVSPGKQLQRAEETLTSATPRAPFHLGTRGATEVATQPLTAALDVSV